MSELKDSALRDAGLAFLGRITAVLSHEVTNAFSVINEMAGLELDILGDAAKGQPPDLLEIERVCQKIRKHVRRGEAAVRSINWMAHSVDRTSAVIDLNQTLTRIVSVAERWLSVRRASFALDVPEAGASLETRPFFLAFAVLLGLDAVTPRSSDEQTISIGYAEGDGGAVLTIDNGDRGDISPADDDKTLRTLSSLMTALGGQLRRRPGEGAGGRVELFIPATRRPDERDDIEKKEAR
jgi:hypothetical protein